MQKHTPHYFVFASGHTVMLNAIPKTNHTLTFQKVGSDAVSTNLEDFVQRIHKTSQLPQWWMMQGTSLQLGHSNGIPELSHLKV